MRKLGHEALGNTPSMGIRLSLEDKQYLIAVGKTVPAGIRELIKRDKLTQDKLKNLSNQMK